MSEKTKGEQLREEPADEPQESHRDHVRGRA